VLIELLSDRRRDCKEANEVEAFAVALLLAPERIRRLVARHLAVHNEKVERTILGLEPTQVNDARNVVDLGRRLLELYY
jgi:hypothetical protein